MQLLRYLGMDLKVSPNLILVCAKALHGAAVAAGGVRTHFWKVNLSSLCPFEKNGANVARNKERGT